MPFHSKRFNIVIKSIIARATLQWSYTLNVHQVGEAGIAEAKIVTLYRRIKKGLVASLLGCYFRRTEVSCDFILFTNPSLYYRLHY